MPGKRRTMLLVQDRLLLVTKGSHFIPSQACLRIKRQMSTAFLTGSHPRVPVG